MGREAELVARLDGDAIAAKVQLESDTLRLRGDRALKVSFAEIRVVGAEDGWLSLAFGEHLLELPLGAAAGRWRKAIESPPTLLDKLGVKPGQSIAALGFADRSFLGETPHATSLVAGAKHDLVLLHAPSSAGLRAVREARRAVAPKGGLWIVYPRGSKEIPERHVRAAALGDGWVDVKTCRFDEVRTALKFVRRVGER